MQSSRRCESFPVQLAGGASVTALHYLPDAPEAGATFIVAHGAGAGQSSAFMIAFADALAARGFDVVTFNFPYTEQKRRLPDRAPVLESCYAAVIAEVVRRVPSAALHLFIGGKSMGGRMATQLAASDATLPVAGLVLLGYPFHPPAKPEKRRDAHLPSVRRPMLVVQGTRDTFGPPDEIRPTFAALTPPAVIHAVEGGDHSFKVARAGAAGQAAIDTTIRDAVAQWMRDIIQSPPAS
ncbi:MAG: alpha/beta fold hydrolase [Vicinamibacterales bacterium]